jgi:hypothetical protein
VEQVTVSNGAGIIDVGNHHGKLPPLTESLRIALATGQVRRPLGTTLRPLLTLLTDGRYELTGPEPLFDDRRLVPAGGWPAEDTGRVEYYRRAVRAGLRPVAVLMHDVILDGRHKIVAYQAERLAPTVIRIAAFNRESDPTAPRDAGPRRPSATR